MAKDMSIEMQIINSTELSINAKAQMLKVLRSQPVEPELQYVVDPKPVREPRVSLRSRVVNISKSAGHGVVGVSKTVGHRAMVTKDVAATGMRHGVLRVVGASDAIPVVDGLREAKNVVQRIAEEVAADEVVAAAESAEPVAPEVKVARAKRVTKSKGVASAAE